MALRRLQKYKRPRYTRLLIQTFLLLSLFLILFFRRTPNKTLYSVYHTAPSPTVSSFPPNKLSYTTHNFTLNHRPIRIVSGSVHYFRTTPSNWRPILLAARRAGLNAISTYIPWNLHETRPGYFRWSGMLDLRLFLEIAHEIGLLVLLRPGPYICSEWDFGGLPPYLLSDPFMRVRSSYPPYMSAVNRYFDQVYYQIRPYIGRPIVALQLENEYGAFGAEKAYMEAIHAAWVRRLGEEQLMFFTSDNGGPAVMSRGSPFDSARVLKTVNFDRQPAVRLGILRSIQPQAPAMVAEFWAGWFDHWGEKHHTRDAAEVVNDVRQILFTLDASINLYMFFGGTNFGFMSGANIGENMTYQADTTSYDYDAFLNEHAEIRSDKYDPLRELLQEFWTMLGDQAMLKAMQIEPPERQHTIAAYSETIPLSENVPLLKVLDVVTDARTYSNTLRSMEDVGGDYGFILYRHNLAYSLHSRELHISGIHDLAYILADDVVLAMIDRNEQFVDDSLRTVYIPATSKRLDVLVENRGRVNYGPYIHDRKGILGKMTIEGSPVQDFEISTMSFRTDHPLLRDADGKDVIGEIRRVLRGWPDRPALGVTASPPTFFRGTMLINPGTVKGFGGNLPGMRVQIHGRGLLWVNAFNCGRFHTGSGGPQGSLFVPGELLREGSNEIVVLQMDMGLFHDTKVQLVP